MAREQVTRHIIDFPGIATNGLAASQPVRRAALGDLAFFRDARNLHRPEGDLTNRNAGYIEQVEAPTNGGRWRLLAFLKRGDGGRHFYGIANGRLFSQGNLTGTWSEIASGLDDSGRYVAAQYADRSYFCNGIESPRYFDGTSMRLIQLPKPLTAPTVNAPNSGSDNATLVYTYQYKRSADGFLGKLSPPTTIILNGSQSLSQIDLTGLDTSTAEGIDTTRIYRDGNLVAEIPSTQNFYTDNATAPAGIAATMEVAIEPFNFNKIAVVGDRIYVAGVFEDGVLRSNRVRWCAPGQPWRWDADDFTDEIEAPIEAIIDGDRGPIMFTRNRAYELQHVGGGVHVIAPTELPGAQDQWNVTRVPGGIAYATPAQIYLATPRGLQNLTDPGDGTSIESLWATFVNNNWDVHWLIHYPRFNYILAGVVTASGGQEPDTVLVYDIARRGWWRFEWGGVYPVVVPGAGASNVDTRLVIGLADGSVIDGMSGNTADGSQLQPTMTIGPTDFGTYEEKRFRMVSCDYDPESNALMRHVFDVDKGATRGVEEQDAKPGGVLLDEFQLDVDVLGSTERQTPRFPTPCHGRYAQSTITEIIGTAAIEITAVDIKYQPVKENAGV